MNNDMDMHAISERVLRAAALRHFRASSIDRMTVYTASAECEFTRERSNMRGDLFARDITEADWTAGLAVAQDPDAERLAAFDLAEAEKYAEQWEGLR